MSALLDNAIGSIRVGVQDYRSPDDHRYLSAVRNYYAGILLLAKEVLVRRFPNEDPDILIAAQLKPQAGPNGTVEIVPAEAWFTDVIERIGNHPNRDDLFRYRPRLVGVAR